MIRHLINEQLAKTLIQAHVISQLDYCNSLLFGLPQNQISRLQRVQNAAARVISCQRKSEHISPVLRELHWLPVSFRVRFKILTLMFKARNGLAPKYLCDLISDHTPSRSLRSSSQNLVHVPKTRTITYGDRAFSKSGPTLWNSLPIELRNTQTFGKFKTQLKTHLFSVAYN